ncbi:MAG: hypothetical protein FOGNACKC_05513 [Anaerolineae bacterium]|nr:hypothetical protein [Anaerolineae bacterium]
MPQFRTGDMLTHWNTPDLLLITTNACVNAAGGLVMGAGVARQMRDRFRGLDRVLAQQIIARSSRSTRFSHNANPYKLYLPSYDLLVSPEWPVKKLGLFQVKARFCDAASLSQIQESATALLLWCVEHPAAEVWLNFPGIGNGRLGRSEVLPIVKHLPDNVVIWELGR